MSDAKTFYAGLVKESGDEILRMFKLNKPENDQAEPEKAHADLIIEFPHEGDESRLGISLGNKIDTTEYAFRFNQGVFLVSFIAEEKPVEQAVKTQEAASRSELVSRLLRQQLCA